MMSSALILAFVDLLFVQSKFLTDFLISRNLSMKTTRIRICLRGLRTGLRTHLQVIFEVSFFPYLRSVKINLSMFFRTIYPCCIHIVGIN